MARAWVLDGRSIARKVTRSSSSIKDAGASRECPNCRYKIDNSDVMNEWPGFPAGVKFAPTDAELLEHLAAKCGVSSSKEPPHVLIDEFIPTLDGDNGICSAHPENLPGAKKDGSCVHFFHRTRNAYATGQRKRRRIDGGSTSGESVRWHKTGRTKVVVENRVKKGCKKIMVLYKSSKRGRGGGASSRPADKAGWKMHQFHLGTEKDETAGEYVVSRIFYQMNDKNGKSGDRDETSNIQSYDTITAGAGAGAGAMHVSPRTPNPNPPNPRRRYNDFADDATTTDSSVVVVQEEQKVALGGGEEVGYEAWLAGESQPVDETPDFTAIDDSSLARKELPNPSPSTSPILGNNSTGNNNGISVLENLEMDTPPDFQLSDLQFGSQDSNWSWLDKY